jgi:hypothetical protein
MSTASSIASQRKSGGDAGGDVFGAPGQTLFGVPITHILEIVGSARPQPVPLAPALWAGWFTIAATC